MRVLIATPTYADTLRPETVKSVQAQTFGGTWEWQRIKRNPHPAPDNRNVLASYQHIREIFLRGTWDALLTVEHDMVLPPDALQKLWDTGAPVAYGVYLLRHESLVLNTCEYVGDLNMGESLSLHPHKARRGEVVKVSGVGFGCTLFRRSVVERIPFHDGGDTGQSPDVPFAQDCVKAGVTQVAHFGVVCGHIEAGHMLMPYQDDQRATRRVRMNVSLNAMVDGVSTPLVKGEEYDMPARDAIQLRRGGYAEAIPDAVVGSSDALLQAPADAPAQRAKPARAKRSRLGTIVPG